MALVENSDPLVERAFGTSVICIIVVVSGIIVLKTSVADVTSTSVADVTSTFLPSVERASIVVVELTTSSEGNVVEKIEKLGSVIVDAAVEDADVVIDVVYFLTNEGTVCVVCSMITDGNVVVI